MYLFADLIVILVFLIGAAALGFLLGRRSLRQRITEQQHQRAEQQRLLANTQTKLKRTMGQRLALEQELTEVRTHLSGRGIDTADIQADTQENQSANRLTSSVAATASMSTMSVRPETRELNGRPHGHHAPTSVDRPKPPSKQDETLRRIRDRADKINFDRIEIAEAGRRDDLKRIENIGIFTEKKLNALGIRTFNQIANLNERDQHVVNQAIELSSGRIARDGWVEQAKRLVEG